MDTEIRRDSAEIKRLSGNSLSRTVRPKVQVLIGDSNGAPSLISLIVIGLFALVLFTFIKIKSVEASTYAQSVEVAATEEEREAAKGLESLLINQMVEEMRKSVPENELVPKSQAERVFESMLDSEYARAMSASGNFGIADQVLAEMKGKR